HHRHRLYRRPPPLGVPGQPSGRSPETRAEEHADSPPRPWLRNAMPTREITIINKLGLHARAAAKFVGVASGFPCQVQVGRSAESLVDGKSRMAVMMLGAGTGTPLHAGCGGGRSEAALGAPAAAAGRLVR